MTVQRVNIARDKAKVVRKMGDAALTKAFDVWLDDCIQLSGHLGELKSKGAPAVRKSREVYKICERKLKDRSLSKNDRAQLTSLLKLSYHFTMDLKKLGLA